MEVLLNTPGETDGLYRMWADSALIIERTDVDLRGSTGELINECMLDCYWNGGSPKEQKRYYDNFILSTRQIGPVRENSGAVERHMRRSPRLKTPARMSAVLRRRFDASGAGVYIIIADGDAQRKYSLRGIMIK